MRLLRETLSSAEPYVIAGDVGLIFLDALPLDEALRLLEQLLAEARAQVGAIEQGLGRHLGLGIDLAIEHQAVLLRADEAWLTQLIERRQARQSTSSTPAAPSVTNDP